MESKLVRVNREFELVVFDLADSKWLENGVELRGKSYFVLIYLLFRVDR